MEVAASIVAIVCSACELAWKVQQLIQTVKQHDEKMKDLEDKLDEIKIILEGASKTYGQNGSKSHSTLEQKIRKKIENLVVGCNKDLKEFESKLKRLIAHGNWASVAWKQKFIAPALAEIETSLSDRQQRLNMLVQLLQGLELRSMINILHEFFPDNTRPTSLRDDSNADADSLEREATSLIDAAVPADDSESGTPPQSPELLKSKENGMLLLDAIQGDKDTFERLLSSGETSLVEKDAKERTPLLLAAHLGKVNIVKMILARDAEKGDQRENDYTATDSVGRTVLHYFAEYGMYHEACILLDNDVDIDARDDNDCPPAYYAVKWRRYKVVELLLEKGASTDFDRAIPEGTSHEIEELLKKAEENERSALGSSPG